MIDVKLRSFFEDIDFNFYKTSVFFVIYRSQCKILSYLDRTFQFINVERLTISFIYPVSLNAQSYLALSQLSIPYSFAVRRLFYCLSSKILAFDSAYCSSYVSTILRRFFLNLIGIASINSETSSLWRISRRQRDPSNATLYRLGVKLRVRCSFEQWSLDLIIIASYCKTVSLRIDYNYLIMQEERVKLITSDNTDGKYAVLLDHEIGRGGFGIVYKAVDFNNRQDRLAVKIVPLEGTKRQSVEGELRILRQLPPHPNLVRVKPIKCYSQSNYYIIMQYCRDGTIYDLIKTKKAFSQHQVIDVFYQLVKGYKILFDKKILHQDLKPENVLIDRGVYKLADFGLSIFYEGYKFTNRRQGTLNYISPQKLTKLDYKGNPRSDIYSMGVILYELIIGRHPYIRTHGKKELKNFLQELKQSKLTLPIGFSNNHSLKFLQLFDIILRMLTKTEAQRISFEQIWNYVQTSENFEPIRRAQRQQSRQLVVSQYHLIVSEVSKVLTVPISSSQAEEKDLRQRIQNEKQQEKSQADALTVKLLTNYIFERRIVIYFLDRLARRLIVEQMKKGKRAALYDSVTFQLLLLSRAIANQITQEIRNPHRFTISDWKKLKVNNEHKILLDLVAKDEGYIQDSTCDFLAEDSELSKKELRDLFQIYKSNDIKAQLGILRDSLLKLMAQKARFVEAQTLDLATFAYLEEAEKVVNDLPGAIQRSQELVALIHEIETSQVCDLRKKVQQACTRHGLLAMMEIPQIQEEFNQGEALIS